MKLKPRLLIWQYILFTMLTVLTLKADALNFSGTRLVLNCPERGNVEVILHVYGHIQEKWSGNFETGAGHKTVGNTDIIQFVNGDTILHDRRNDTYNYAYIGLPPLKHCLKLSENKTHPSF